MPIRPYTATYLIPLFLAGCATIPSIGPFYSYHSSPEKTEWALRPLVSKYVDKKEGICEYQFLYPLGRYKRSGEGRTVQFIPFVKSKKCFHEENKTTSSEYFPFFWGKTKKGEPYGGFFPFYGSLKERFGRDRMTFVLWPLYSSSHDEGTSTYKFLWPFFTYIKGKNSKGFRIWPLYGQDKKEGIYSKSFILWPFFIRQRTDLDTDNPKSFFAVFPLYVSTKTPSERSRTILFPLFTFYERERDNFRQRTYPWPILSYAKGDDYESRNVLPLYSYQNKKNSKNFYILWPIYKHQIENDEKTDTITDRFLLINKYERTHFKQGNKKAKILRLWPVFYYRQSKQGDIKFDFPAIIPIDDEGFERNYGPLLRIYEYRKDYQGCEQSRFLWGLYSYWKVGASVSRDIPFVVSYKKDVNFRKFSLLKGAFEYQSRGDKNSLRLLYLPWRINWQVNHQESS